MVEKKMRVVEEVQAQRGLRDIDIFMK